MRTFKEDIGFPSGANAVAEPSDLGQVKGAKKQKSPNGVARVKNKIDTKPTINNKINEGYNLSGSNSSPFHKEKAIRCHGVVTGPDGELKVKKQIAKASDYPELANNPHIHHSQIAKAAKVRPVPEEDEGFIGHDDKFYSTSKLHSKVNDYISKHGHPDNSDRINFSRKDIHSVLRFHEGLEENKFVEKKDSHAVIGFGRFNPPHAGHQVLIDKIRSHAALVGGKPHVFVSHSEGTKKNPIPYHKKIKLMKKAFGGVVHETEAKNPYDVAKELNGKFDHLTLVAGEDRIKGYKEMLKSGEGKDFNFKSVNFKSVPRDDLSATKMRQWALEGNHKDFEASLPDALKSKSKKIMKSVKKGLIKEELQNPYQRAENLRRAKLLGASAARGNEVWGRYDQKDGYHGMQKALEHKGNVYTEKHLGEPIHDHITAKWKLAEKGHFPASAIDKGEVHHGFVDHKGTFRSEEAVKKIEDNHYDNHVGSGNPDKKCLICKHESMHEEVTISEEFLVSFLQRYLERMENVVPEKDAEALEEKAEKSGIELDLLREVYEAAVDEWYIKQNQTFLTAEQWAFNRVNSFIHENIKVHKLECTPCNKHYESRYPKQDCPTCHTRLKVTDTYEQGPLHPDRTHVTDVTEESKFNHHASACTKCNKIYNNFSCAFTCKHPLIRIGLCDKCKNLSEDHDERLACEKCGSIYMTCRCSNPKTTKVSGFCEKCNEEHGAGFIGTDKLVKKYAKVTPGQSKLKVLHNKYIEDKYVTEEQLPQVKGKQLYKAFLRDGWTHKRTVGSHRIMSKEGRGNFVLCHGDNQEIHSPMVNKIVKQSGLNPDRLREELSEAHEPDLEKETRRQRILKKYAAKGTGSDRRRQMDAMKAFDGWGSCEHHCPEHGIWNHDIPPETTCHNPAFHPCEKCIQFEPEKGSEFAHLKIDLTNRKKK